MNIDRYLNIVEFEKCVYFGNHKLVEKARRRILQVNPDIDITTIDEQAFQLACLHGRLYVAQWLLQVNPTIDISSKNNYAFWVSCANGCLSVARWILQVHTTINNNNDVIHDAFRTACTRGHLEVAQWLASLAPDKYQITGQDPTTKEITYKLTSNLN